MICLIVQSVMDWLGRSYPDVFVFVVICLAVWFIATRLDRLYRRFKSTEQSVDKIETQYMPEIRDMFKGIVTRLDSLENRFSSLEMRFNFLEMRFNSLEHRVDKLEDKASSLVVVFGKIATFLVTRFKLSPDTFVGKSPLQLTEFGQSLLERSGGKAYIDDNLVSLILALERKAPKSGLDVDDECYVIFCERDEAGDLVSIKDFVFNNPYIHTGKRMLSLTAGFIYEVMSIYLRNRYLEKYPEIGRMKS